MAYNIVPQHWVISPVSSELVGYKTSRDLSDNIAPEKGSMDQAHRLRVPVKLCRLCNTKTGLMEV